MVKASEKNWRKAKLPQWIVEAIQDEIDTASLRGALAWPNEAKPEPLPFRWGDYDMLHGKAETGLFYQAGGPVFIARRRELSKEDRPQGYSEFVFKDHPDKPWNGFSATRGPLYRTRREAKLAKLWEQCEAAAKILLESKKGLDR